MKIREFKKEFAERLGKEFPHEEVQSFFNILAEKFLHMSRLQLALEPQKELSAEALQEFWAALERLERHEPIQYITGETEFFGMKFLVNRHVLIPRPETEELVEWMLEDLKDSGGAVNILDIGTGSGCIAIALAKKLPQVKVTAWDISQAALETSKNNAELNEVKEVDFRLVDVLQLSEIDGNFDVIVSNPPYVRELEKLEMNKNVLEHEPAEALYVKNEDPLLFYRKITDLAAVSEKVSLYFEINQYLGQETKALLEAKNFRSTLKKDIFGVDRMLRGKKP